MKAKVIKLDSKLFEGEVTKIVIPAIEGEVCILPHHMPLVTPMKSGVIKLYRPDVERSINIQISKGIFSFSKEEAVLLLDN